MARLRGCALVAAMLLAALVAGSRSATAQKKNSHNLIGEVMKALASEWADNNLASLTCETAPDVLLCNDQGQVVSMQLDGVVNPLTGGGDTVRFPTIPAQIGNLTTLTYLSMASNSLTGTVPDSFSNLVQLQLLYARSHTHAHSYCMHT
ncbi:unnamed protein product [Closterium sp. Yama58-4]|nr:unnamed protein product [Closterium sp. Yama58-4]